MGILVCRHCGKEVPSKKKLKHLIQDYCGENACQSARKLIFDRHKYKTNGSFRSNKLRHVRERKKKLAAEGNPLLGSQYQSAYRKTHPEYVLGNRLRQKHRNAKKRRKTSDKTKIVNPDTLILKQSDNEQVYAMFAIDHKKIVNPDTLMPEWIDNPLYRNTKPMFVRLL